MCESHAKSPHVPNMFDMALQKIMFLLIMDIYIYDAFSQYVMMCIKTFGLLTVSWQNVSITFPKSHDNSHDLFCVYIKILFVKCESIRALPAGSQSLWQMNVQCTAVCKILSTCREMQKNIMKCKRKVLVSAVNSAK